MATWVLEVRDLTGAIVLASATYRGLSVGWALNAPGYIEAAVPWDAIDRDDWVVGGRELRVTRDASRIWGGYLWRLEGSTQGEPEVRADVRASGAGYSSRLRQRVATSDLIYTDVNQHQIAWNLIDHTQGQTDGALGLTQGTHTGTARTRDREYCANERPVILDAIDEFTELDDGLDYEVDALGAFNTWSPRRGSVSVVHTFTGAEDLTFDWVEDASEAASYVTAIGAPPDDCAPRVTTVSDATAITRFKRLEMVVDADTNAKSEVLAEANEGLRARKNGLFEAVLAYDLAYGPAWGVIALGDMVRVNVTEQNLAIDQNLRVIGMRLSLENPDMEYMELTLDGGPR